MHEQQSSYRQIMKATSLFGGVQVFQIFISVIRSKFVAVLLGPEGMGIVGLLTTTTGFIGALTNFGLSTSAVKDISESNTSGDQNRISGVISVMRRLAWITGLLGAIVTLILSPWLSQLTFGNKDYTLAFIWISVTLLFNQLSSGQLVILQGLRKLQYLAKANLYGSLVGLVIVVPLYYKFGIRGIVPVIIVTSLISLFFSWYYSRKVEIKPMQISKAKTISEGKNMLTMGFVISLSGLMTMATAYLLRIYINRTGNVADVGLYSAGFTMIGTYVGMIFTAMGTDYYPRLSAVAKSNELSRQAINQQAEIAILIIAPLLIAFLVFINWFVILLYSNQFVAINGMLYWASLGMFFKAASWAIGFIFLAKSASKIYFWSELVAETYSLIFNIIGYHFWGLNGLGFSFLAGYVIVFVQVYIIAKINYQFSFTRSFSLIFTIEFLLAMLSFTAVKFLNQPYPYIVGSILIVLSAWYSFRELEKRIGIKELIQGFLQKNIKN